MAASDWTDETIAQLKSLWAEGTATGEIARRLDMTKNAVVGKAHRLDLPGRPSPIKPGVGVAVPKYKRRVGRVSGLPALASLETPAGAPEPTTPPAPPQAKAEPVPTAPIVAPQRPPAPAEAKLSKHPCAWPLGHPGTPGFRFCGEPAQFGKSYCPEHCAVAFVPNPGRSQGLAP